MEGTARKLSSKRVAWFVTAVALLTLPLVLYGAIKALGSTSNDPRQWLPKDFAATDTYDWFQSQFGSDEIAVVSWPGCTLDDPRVGQLSEALSDSLFFSRVRSGQSHAQGIELATARIFSWFGDQSTPSLADWTRR